MKVILTNHAKRRCKQYGISFTTIFGFLEDKPKVHFPVEIMMKEGHKVVYNTDWETDTHVVVTVVSLSRIEKTVRQYARKEKRKGGRRADISVRSIRELRRG